MQLRLTQVAAADLRDLYIEGLDVWGEAQADRYFDGLLERFDKICAAPRQYQAVDHIRSGYRPQNLGQCLRTTQHLFRD